MTFRTASLLATGGHVALGLNPTDRASMTSPEVGGSGYPGAGSIRGRYNAGKPATLLKPTKLKRPPRSPASVSRRSVAPAQLRSKGDSYSGLHCATSQARRFGLSRSTDIRTTGPANRATSGICSTDIRTTGPANQLRAKQFKPANEYPECGQKSATTATNYASPQTSWAVSMTSRSLLRWASTAISLPCTVLEKPHCGDSASCSMGT